MFRLFRGNARSPPLLATEPVAPAGSEVEAPTLSAAGGIDGHRSSSAGVEDVRQVVQKIQQHAADIRKEACRISGSSNLNESRLRVRAAQQAAEGRAAEAKQLLARLASGSEERPTHETRLQSLMQQKLNDNLAAAVAAVTSAKAAYDAAASKAARAAGNAAASSRTPVEDGGADAEGRQQMQMQEHDIADAEVAFHAALADEYQQQVNVVVQEVHGLRQAMCSLAQHAVAQGDMVDSIESNMSRASEATAKAAEQIAIAKDRQTATMKRLACLLLAAFITSCAILGTTYLQHRTTS